MARQADDAELSRARLLEGLAEAIAAKGYAATTIADIVQHARVSKRTFYEHFADKEACFLASYRAASERALLAIEVAVDPDAPWQEQLESATRAYVRVLEENAPLTRTFLLEIHAAGRRAMRQRAEIHQRFADLLRAMVEVGRRQYPELLALSPMMATALVGGINELVLVALDRDASLREVAGTAADLVRAVLVSG